MRSDEPCASVVRHLCVATNSDGDWNKSGRGPGGGKQDEGGPMRVRWFMPTVRVRFTSVGADTHAFFPALRGRRWKERHDANRLACGKMDNLRAGDGDGEAAVQKLQHAVDDFRAAHGKIPHQDEGGHRRHG